ncbi:MAG: hypothetical protein ABI466_08720, partial [Chloroflexota bacterium]
MNEFARCLVAVARQYVGPAAPAFLTREITAIGLDPDTIAAEHAPALGARVRATAAQIMEPSQAEAFARALALTDASDQDGVDEARSADLGTRILAVARRYLGPAAPTFLVRELAMLGATMDDVTPRHVSAIAERARSSAGVLMDAVRAAAFAGDLAAAADPLRAHGQTADLRARSDPRAPVHDHGGSPAARDKSAGRSAIATLLSAELLESSRLLRANLQPGDVNSAPPPLIVLGATSDEACARVAAGLAAVLAEEGKSTLLVDADL